jgi:hypothetical protein
MNTKTKNPTLFLVISILLAVVGIGLLIMVVILYGPRRPQTTPPEDTIALFQQTQAQVPTRTASPQPEPTQTTPAEVVESSPTPSPSPTPTPEWMVYDQVDFRDQEIEALISMRCNDDQVYMNPFNVVPYSPEIIESGIFNTILDFSMAWEHLGFYGLWIHSGQSPAFGDLPAYPLQLYLENDARGFRRDSAEFLSHMQDCLIGAEMRLRQGDTLSVSEVVAAVRVPPAGVVEVSQNPMELVPYLAENYPDSGFDLMDNPGLLFYFCGRQLTGETFNNDLDYWTQSRIIIGFMPVDGE